MRCRTFSAAQTEGRAARRYESKGCNVLGLNGQSMESCADASVHALSEASEQRFRPQEGSIQRLPRLSPAESGDHSQEK